MREMNLLEESSKDSDASGEGLAGVLNEKGAYK